MLAALLTNLPPPAARSMPLRRRREYKHVEPPERRPRKVAELFRIEIPELDIDVSVIAFPREHRLEIADRIVKQVERVGYVSEDLKVKIYAYVLSDEFDAQDISRILRK